MMLSPLDYACPHLATSQERDRDLLYQACDAQAGQPCLWAKRYDHVANPPFHSERLELTLPTGEGALDPALLREAVLDSGLI